ncbi:MAG: peptide MFS transporter [Chitinophagales bacterium]|nr:peptide MFS transporter [Chitinophagales bacterium]
MALEIIIITIGALFSALMIGVAWFINHKQHPQALWMLFFTEMWERFSFYGMRALLILYMTKVLLYPDKQANLQYGAYNALVYTMPLIGGWIADKLLGFRKSILLGGVLMAIGHLVLAIPMESTFFLGLGFLISGNGFFKPNISSLLGKYYSENDPHKDAGYSIFYMGINIGAFLGSALCGYLGQKINWHLGFGVAGVFMVLGLVVFVAFRNIIAEKGESPVPDELKVKRGVFTTEQLLYVFAFAMVFVAMTLVRLYQVMNLIMIPLGIAALAYIFYTGMKFEKEVREKLWAATLMIFFSVVFWGFYEQSGGSLNLMAERNVDMRIGETLLPSAMVNNSVNPFYIIFLTPLFALMWDWLIRNNIEPTTPMKFGFAFVLLGAGYFVFTLGGKAGALTGLMPLWFFLLGYLLITSGELFLSPIGLSMVTKLSPAQMVGYMMGVWFLASAFGHDLGGWIGSQMAIPEKNANGVPFTIVESLPVYMKGCAAIAKISFLGGIVILASSPFIKKWMHGIK